MQYVKEVRESANVLIGVLYRFWLSLEYIGVPYDYPFIDIDECTDTEYIHDCNANAVCTTLVHAMKDMKEMVMEHLDVLVIPYWQFDSRFWPKII